MKQQNQMHAGLQGIFSQQECVVGDTRFRYILQQTNVIKQDMNTFN